MMLEWLGETEKAERVEEGVAAVIREGRVRTYDMGGRASTLDMGRAIAAAVRMPTPAVAAVPQADGF
jgi:3-isopropylmalate dehydrogenase